MKNEQTYDAIMDRLNAIGDEIFGRKVDTTAEAKKQAEAYNTAFWDTMRSGMPRNELRAGHDGAGAYLVPDTYDDRLVKALSEKNVLRKISHTIQTKHRLHIPVAQGTSGAEWVMEGQPVSFANAEFGEVILDAHKLATSILASDEMLEDGNIDLENFIQNRFAECIGDAEEEAFIHGDGKCKPVGLLYQAPVGAESSSEGMIDMDDMLTLEHSVESPYRKNAVWLMSEDAYRILQNVRAYRGKVLWTETLAEGEPKKLFGYDIFVCKHLEDVAPGNIPVLFGDFSYYWIGERGKRTFKRLAERFADRCQVAFIAAERVDAKLVLPEAVKMLKVSGTPATVTK